MNKLLTIATVALLTTSVQTNAKTYIPDITHPREAAPVHHTRKCDGVEQDRYLNMTLLLDRMRMNLSPVELSNGTENGKPVVIRIGGVRYSYASMSRATLASPCNKAVFVGK